MSHLSAYREVLDANLPWALIMEDDVTIPADLRLITEAVAAQATGAEVALLNFDSDQVCQVTRRGAADLPSGRTLVLPVDVHVPVSAAAYVITREACQRITEGALPIRAKIDDWGHVHDEGMIDRLRCVVPLAVVKDPSFRSTIGYYADDSIKARTLKFASRLNLQVLERAVARRRERIWRKYTRVEFVDATVVATAPLAEGRVTAADEPSGSGRGPSNVTGGVNRLIARGGPARADALLAGSRGGRRDQPGARCSWPPPAALPPTVPSPPRPPRGALGPMRAENRTNHLNKFVGDVSCRSHYPSPDTWWRIRELVLWQPARSMGWAGHQGGHGRKGKGPMRMNRPRDSRDESFDVLVLDAGYKQSLASARSLGRAGLRVVLGESLAEFRPPGSAGRVHLAILRPKPRSAQLRGRRPGFHRRHTRFHRQAPDARRPADW